MRPATVILLALLAGCTAASPEPEPPQRSFFSDQMTLGPHAAREVNFLMDADATARIAFNASGLLEWDLHSHVEGTTPGSSSTEVRRWHVGEGREADVGFRAPASSTYSLFLRATGQTTVVTIEIEGQFVMTP